MNDISNKFIRNILKRYVKKFFPIKKNNLFDKLFIKQGSLNKATSFSEPNMSSIGLEEKKSSTKNISFSESNLKKKVKSETDISSISFVTLKDIMHNEELLISFVLYCINRHASENICFLMEVRLFEESENIIQEGIKIIQTYIINNSPMCININSKTRNNILDNVNIHLNIFLSAKQEVISIIQGDLIVKWNYI